MFGWDLREKRPFQAGQVHCSARERVAIVARDYRRALDATTRSSSWLCFAPSSPSTTMSTADAPRTPVRAIPSTLLSRTAPTIPPASQLYEPLVKGVLRHRLYKTFLHAAVVCWVLVITWRTWSNGSGGSLLMPIKPSTLAYTVMTFCAGALPVVVLRKVHLIGEHRHVFISTFNPTHMASAAPTPATSPSKTMSGAFAKQSTYHALLTYLASSLSLAMLHILITGAYESTVEPHSRLSLFVKSRYVPALFLRTSCGGPSHSMPPVRVQSLIAFLIRKHPYYLNGHLIYALSSQAFVACACLLRCVLLDRFAIRWTSLTGSNDKLQSFGLARVLTVILTSLVYTLMVTIAHLAAFALTRSTVLPLLFQLPFVSMLLRPFTAHFLRGQWTLMLLNRHWSLVSRTFYLALSTVGIWEFAESSFDSIVAEVCVDMLRLRTG